MEREAKVVAALESNPGASCAELVPHAYDDVHERLYGWAERSLLAHLLKLENDGKANKVDDHWSLAVSIGN